MVERDDDVRVAHRRVDWAPWSPAQFIALALGALYIIMGALALGQTGISAAGFINTHVVSLGLHHTGLLGAIELIYGLLMVLAGVVPGASRGLMSFLGVLALGFGIVFLIQPVSFHGALGVHEANGWFYLITGIVTLVAAMAAPIMFGRDRRSSASRRDVVYRS
jgi:hypothetical protein